MWKARMFWGEYSYRVDPQGRVPLPPHIRDQFRGGLVLTRGFDRCLYAFTPKEWETYSPQVASYPRAQEKRRRMNRITFANAFLLEPDRQGRVLLPQPLRQYAQITDEVVIAGVGNYLELWAKDLWTQEQTTMDQQAWGIAESTEERE